MNDLVLTHFSITLFSIAHVSITVPREETTMLAVVYSPTVKQTILKIGGGSHGDKYLKRSWLASCWFLDMKKYNEPLF